MLSVITWKWAGTRPYQPEHVNTLRQMVAEHYRKPHRFICVTDDAQGLDPRIEVVPLPAFEHLPVQRGFPSCFVRLWAFSKEARAHLGERFVSLDLDVVILRDVTSLFDTPGEFVAWSDTDNERFRYQGGFYVMDAGTRSFVWDDFKGAESQAAAAAAGFIGSDQAWMSYVMGDEITVGRHEGLWKASAYEKEWPVDARLVQMHGGRAPWGWRIKQSAPDLHAAWRAARDRAMKDAVWVNTQDFRDGRIERKAGAVNEAPRPIHKLVQLVRAEFR